VALPLETFTELRRRRSREIVSLKLALVGSAGFEEFYPSEISGGHAQARPAWPGRWRSIRTSCSSTSRPAGLDPLSSESLDDLILELRASLGATMVVVTHELRQHLAIADRAVVPRREHAAP
jgi:phospholipid/cholesterol/gamma-HCH transport system ATP-binding protein